MGQLKQVIRFASVVVFTTLVSVIPNLPVFSDTNTMPGDTSTVSGDTITTPGDTSDVSGYISNEFAATQDCPSGSSEVKHLPTYGGNYYCGYGSHYYRFSDGTQQVFVIGTDFSVWTRWQKDGRLSNWVSLGGKIRHTYNSSDFHLELCGNKPYVDMFGLDNRLWYTIRENNGVWSKWQYYYGLACPPS